MNSRLLAKMSIHMEGSPEATRVTSLKPPAASSTAAGWSGSSEEARFIRATASR
jgi:hypothetical protein